MRLRLSLRNQLALGFFAITLVAIGGLYMYVAPGLRSQLVGADLRALQVTAVQDSLGIRQAIAAPLPVRQVRELLARAAARSGDRVTLLAVQGPTGSAPPAIQPAAGAGATQRAAHALAGIERSSALPAALTGQLVVLADSSGMAPAGPPARFPAAAEAVSRRRPATGTESTSRGTLAEAAVPVAYRGHPAAVAYSTPAASILRTVSTVRREILVAGAVALALAVAAASLMAGALGKRVRRLELAARRVAAGEFGQPLPVDSSDELGRLAATFNEMQQQLEQLELARKKFIATASHELRTPIFSLGGFLELLEDEDLDADTRRRFLDQVRAQVRRLGKLSVDLLDLSRLEAGSLELRVEEVDLRELTRSVTGEFEPTLAQQEARLQLRLPARRLEIVCDPVRVAQIMRILIDNAITHTPPGTEVVVTAAQVKGEVQLAVHDDGRGIDTQALPRIFEPFYTADDAQGSGLGLAIASELADRMDGRLSVRSTPGDTEFTLELPA